MREHQDSVPFLDLWPEIEQLRGELIGAFESVLESTCFVLGPNVSAFEKEVASYLGTKYAIGVNSGTDALVIALKALGVKPGHEVITTSFTFYATVEAVLSVGATPVLADIDEETYNLDPDHVQGLITPLTSVILPVHLFGQGAEMGDLKGIAANAGVRLLEDVAQAFGAKYSGKRLGTIGDAAAFSFFPSKNLGGFGDGGLIVTNDRDVADTAKMLRAHGSREKYLNEMVGHNSRLDEIQAALLRVKLPNIDRLNQKRGEVASRYNRALSRVSGISTPRVGTRRNHVYHQYTIRFSHPELRERVRRELTNGGIPTMVYYPRPIHRLPVWNGPLRGDLRRCEQASREVLSLPIWPQMPNGIQERVISALRGAIRP